MQEIIFSVIVFLMIGVQEISKSGSTFHLDHFWLRTSHQLSHLGLLLQKPWHPSKPPFQPKTQACSPTWRTMTSVPTTSTLRFSWKHQQWKLTNGIVCLRAIWNTCTTVCHRQLLTTLLLGVTWMLEICLDQEPSQPLRRVGLDLYLKFAGKEPSRSIYQLEK